MADIDTDLSARLSRLAAAVPVSHGRLDPVHRGAIEARQRVRMAWLTPLVVIVVGVAAFGLLDIKPFEPGATPSPGPVSATTRSGDFELTIGASRGFYAPGESIDIRATLTYLGSEGPIDIGHGSGSPMSFGIVEPINGLVLQPGWRASCNSSELSRGIALEQDFAKSGGFEGTDPRAGEWQAFYDEPDLFLSAGTWHPYVQANFSVGECGPGGLSIRTEIEIVVGDVSAAESPAKSSGPVAASTRNGQFSLSIHSSHGVVEAGEPIDVFATLTYLGTESTTISHARGVRGSPIGFGIDEPIFGGDRLAPSWDLACTTTTIVGETPVSVSFAKMGGGSVPTSDLAIFMLDPELRLPPGIWHLYTVARFSLGNCFSAVDAGARVEMRVDVKVTVTGANHTEPPNPDPPQPTVASSPDPAEPVVDVDEDDLFRLELSANKREYLDFEPIDIRGVFTYLGAEPIEISGFYPLGFSIEEPVHGLRLGWLGTRICAPETLDPGEQFESPYIKLGLSQPEDLLNETQQAFMDDRLFRLPVGTWTIHLASSLRNGRDCDEPGRRFSTTIEIVVRSHTTDPLATEPPARPTTEPSPDGTPVDIDRDEEFELKLRSAERVFRSDEPIDLETIYTYIGPDLNVLAAHWAPEISFSIEQLDAEGEVGWAKVYDSACAAQPLTRGIGRDISLTDANLTLVRVVSLRGGFDTLLSQGLLHLLPGRYRISAGLSTFLGGCGTGQPDGTEHHGLTTSIEIVVVPSGWTRLPIDTANARASACTTGTSGSLSPNPTSGIGITRADGTSVHVRWPFAWSGWRDSTGVALMNEAGEVVAREGEDVNLEGNGMDDGDFSASCGVR